MRTFVLDSVATAADVELDPTMGNALFYLAACDRMGHAGISYTYEPAGEGVSFYAIGINPDQDATSTDENGQAGIVNLPPGFATISARREATGEFIGRKRVLVRAGVLTYAAIVPGPAG